MTRWARSGNTQQHKKMPGEATPWSEFSHGVQKNSPKKQKKRKQNFGHSRTPENVKNQSSDFFVDKSPAGKRHCAEVSTVSEIKVKKESGEESSIKQTLFTKKNKKKNKLAKLNATKTDSGQSDKGNDTSLAQSSQNKAFEKNRNTYMDNLKKKRIEKGILLLPSKVERKLYNLKRNLREKGVPPGSLKEIIREERRKQELKFRKTFNPSKKCFNCRQAGHILADCPQQVDSVKQETGICFKCGSDTHTSFRCPNKVQGYPFAKCFICKEQGHITRDCPKNERGVYPKGGRCNLCGNVNHLRKDCPSLMKQTTEEPSITLHTINKVASVDAEIIDQDRATKPKNVKKPKHVKF